MKRLFLILVLALAACTTPVGTTPAQAFINDATNATVLVDQVTLAADAAVKAGALKGNDALTTLGVIRAARDGLNAAKVMAATDPATARSKVGITLAALTATQTYLAILGAPK